MSWSKYPKIFNLTYKFDDGKEWIGLEKIHGCNFGVEVNALGDFKYFRRNGELTDGESFYKHETTMKKYKLFLNNIYRMLKSSYVIYGEYCGGNGRDCKSVQKEIMYTDEYKFIPFDIFHNGKFIPYDELCNILEVTGFDVLKPLVKGSLVECCNFDVERVLTTIPKMFGHEPLPDNFIEGIVIRPLDRNVFFKEDRVMLKKKAKSFMEKREPSKAPKVKVVLDPESEKYCSIVSAYITENRLNNLMSKEPEYVDSSQIGRLVTLLIEDALEDLFTNQEEQDIYITYQANNTPKKLKKIDKIIKNKAFQLVRNKINSA